MTDRLTKFNEETGEYEYKERAKTQEEFNAQRKAVIQRLGEFEDRAEGEINGAHWEEENRRAKSSKFICSACGGFAHYIQPTRVKNWKKKCLYKYCPHCRAKMKGECDE